ncbi:MAG: hypothetical protein HY790_05825 [Deltaproteobacteria bacterium]|nr:hypothetical protein [Deltaproteobacteria bacterium]
MQGEIITTGTELITGRVGDFNARYAARRLHEAGLGVQSITILGDNAPLFQDLLAQGLSRSQFIIITGGLGPTDDDLTVAAAAQALNLRLFEDEPLFGGAGITLGRALRPAGRNPGRSHGAGPGGLGLRFFPEASGRLALFSPRRA